MPLRPAELVLQRVQEVAPVQELRQIIDGGEHAEPVGRLHQAGNVVEGYHATAVRQDFGFEVQDAAVAHPELHRRSGAVADQGEALSDIIIHRLAGGVIDAGGAGMVDEVAEMVSPARRRRRQGKYAVVGAVDETRLEILVQ